MEQTLYKRDKNDTVRVWKIKVCGDIIYVEYGTDGGKFIKKQQKITEGKNIGKKNETSSNKQAILEAESKIRKKRDEGYCDNVEDDTNQIYPMLAHAFDKFSHKITFPCYIQPKLDGYRMIYNHDTNDMITRNNKKYKILYDTNLHKELKKIKLVLDGELYIHDPDYAFENYGVLRKKELKQEDISKVDGIKYYVFDIISDKIFEERLKIIQTFDKYKYIIPVKTYTCLSRQDIDKYHKIFLECGYEGSMVRNKTSKYTNSRSYDLLKYKNFDDDEFVVVGFGYESKFSDDNMKPVIWKCVTTSGKEFDVQSKGTRQERDLLYKYGKSYIGKFLSVKFFGYTDEGIPRFPKTLRDGKSSFRDEI